MWIFFGKLNNREDFRQSYGGGSYKISFHVESDQAL